MASRSGTARRLWLWCGLVLAFATPVSAVSIGPGGSLEIPFVIPGTPLAGGRTPDVFAVSIGGSASGLESLSVQLRDGGLLLGEAVTGFQTLWAFIHPGSLWELNAVPADLSGLVDDGTFAGVVRFTPTFQSGAPSPGLEIEFPLLTLGFATQPSRLLPADPAVAVIPEPATLVLLGGGLLGLGGRGSRRSAAPVVEPRSQPAHAA